MSNNEKDLTDVNSGPPTAESTGEQAAELSRRYGFYTFPVEAPRNSEGGKKPLIKGWEQAATTDGSLFQDRPWANIGLALGRSGHLVLDVDGPEGEEAAREILGGEIPKTLTVRTGRDGGRHYYFKLPESVAARSRNGIARDLDLKAGGGYVLGPPSFHASGRQYEFEDPDVPIAELSEEQGQALAGSGPGYREVLTLEELERRLAPGEGNERIEYVRELLGAIPNDSNFDAREDWIGIAHSIKIACGEEHESEAFELFDEWSSRWEGDGVYDPDETRHAFDTLSSSHSGGFLSLLRRSRGLGHEPSGRILEALHQKTQLEARSVFEPVELADSETDEDAFLDSGTSPPERRFWLSIALNDTQRLLAEVKAAWPSLSPEEREIAEAALIEQLHKAVGRQAAAGIVRRVLRPNDRDPFTPEGVLKAVDLSTADLNVPYLVQGLIPAASVGLLVSPHSMGKSFLAIDLALSVSFGVPWLGSQTTDSGPALFIVAEGQAAFPLRLAGWLVAHGELPERFTQKALSGALSGRAIITRYPLRLDDPRLVEGLIQTVRKSGSRIVVMDTLGRLLGNEQSDDHNDTANRVMRDLQDVVTETGATILLIHHTGHENKNRARGASAWEQAADFVYVLKGSATISMLATRSSSSTRR